MIQFILLGEILHCLTERKLHENATNYVYLYIKTILFHKIKKIVRRL